jgi:beta-mannosidase
MARIHGASDREAFAIGDWQMAILEPRKSAEPGDVDGATWIAAPVPGTAASALRAAGNFRFETSPAFDRHDVWYRARFSAKARANTREHARAILRFDGLATLADVWLDGEHVLGSSNMFHAHEVDITERLRGDGEHTLLIRFRSLQAELAVRRPRPRWRTRLVESQQLRWIRTTLLGRIPAWSPPVAAVGPWRPVVLEWRQTLLRIGADVKTRVDGQDGVVHAAIRLRVAGARTVTGATLRVGESRTLLDVTVVEGETLASGTLRIPNVALWWPHTHGEQPLYEARLTVAVDGADIDVELGRAGFRHLERASGSGFGLRVNGVDVFCRGACWTPLDVVSLSASREAYREALLLAQGAGMNMIRVGGTMVYEDDAFYELCDEFGILVFQDFMLANMDYPAEDAEFAASVKREAEELVGRLGLSPCLAVLCGGSEVEQQAAMVGMPREQWTNSLFQELLPGVAREGRPDVLYAPSTPTGGALPFHVDTGIAHYFGVGAYLRPFEDARRSGVRFAAECLAFANIPCDETIEELLGDGQAAPHHPLWKARVPRDAGPGWDFDDVRDYYVRELFSVDPARVRYADSARYLALGRAATGEAMARTFGEWRGAGSVCAGGLVWFYRDLWPGAGWGVIDANGRPKAAYYYLKRALSKVALFASDEGLNGVELSVVNDGPDAVNGELEVTLFRGGVTVIAKARAPVVVPGRGKVAVRADAILPHFFDTTYAYRFGPPGFDALVTTLEDRDTGAKLAEAFFFPPGIAPKQEELGLEAAARASENGTIEVTLSTQKLAHAVALEARGFVPDDSHFHLAPGAARTVTLRPIGRVPSARLDGWAAPLNAASPTRLRLV